VNHERVGQDTRVPQGEGVADEPLVVRIDEPLVGVVQALMLKLVENLHILET
jgi:hypothetical protein